jgi:RES domain
MEDKDPIRKDPLNNFNNIQIDGLLIKVKKPCYRLNDARFPTALHFDTSGKGRFDGPNQGYGILYVGEDVCAAFIECFGRKPQQERNISEKLIRSRNLFEINSSESLTFADLTGKGLNIIGASLDIIYGDKLISRKWAKAIFLHPSHVDGIKYCSRLDPSKYNYGIFDRAKNYLSESDIGNLVDCHPQLLGKILDSYEYGLV